MANRLDGHTVVVVGAAGNLGPVWVDAGLLEGASVIACGLGATTDDALRHLASAAGDRLQLVDLDLSDSSDSAFSGVIDALSARPIDGLVLNAGIDSVPGTGKRALSDYSVDDWHAVFAINVYGVIHFLNRMIPHLANPSSVVTVGSMYGIVSPKPEMYSHYNDGAGSMKNPAYGASKAALLAATRQYGTYLAPKGTRVNMLTLGGVAAGQDDGFVSKFEGHVPQHRMVPRDELPGALVFLLSGDSLSMTGHNLVVDGGYTAW